MVTSPPPGQQWRGSVALVSLVAEACVMGSLEGRTVVVTRSAAQNVELRRLLEDRGARVVEMPLIAIVDPVDGGRQRDGELARLHEFDWVVVTSPNGAQAVARALAIARDTGSTSEGPHFAVVGNATARALGVTPDLVPEQARAEELVAAFPSGSGRVLLVQGDLADDVVADGLTAKGWTVTKVVAYRTEGLTPVDDRRALALAADAVLFASGSAARAWFAAFGATAPSCVVAIGPSTADVVCSLGIALSAVAREQTLESLVEAAENALSAQ